MAVLKKGARITGADRTKLASELKKPYDKGKSIRELADTHGRSYGFVHRVLSESGVTLRGRGGATRTKAAAKAKATLTKTVALGVPSATMSRTRRSTRRPASGSICRRGRHDHPRPSRPAERAVPGHVDGADPGPRRAAPATSGSWCCAARAGRSRPGSTARCSPAAPPTASCRCPGCPQAEATARIAAWQQAFDWSSRPDLVSIAAVQGHAIGGGFQLALGCDIRILADDAQFTMAEPALGIVPDLGGTKRLVDLVGYSRAAEICLTGRRVGAEEALRIGLASRVVPDDDLDAAVEQTVAALLAVDRDAAAETKALLQHAARPHPGRAAGGRARRAVPAAARARRPRAPDGPEHPVDGSRDGGRRCLDRGACSSAMRKRGDVGNGAARAPGGGCSASPARTAASCSSSC